MLKAFAGAVVSNPTAKNTTSLSGLFCAMVTASSGEYNILTSAPCAFASSKLLADPGTLNISPNEQSITPGDSANRIASSII
ncbi:hypothetical protein D3C80_1406600 [compost metagenome]